MFASSTLESSSRDSQRVIVNAVVLDLALVVTNSTASESSSTSVAIGSRKMSGQRTRSRLARARGGAYTDTGAAL